MRACTSNRFAQTAECCGNTQRLNHGVCLHKIMNCTVARQQHDHSRNARAHDATCALVFTQPPANLIRYGDRICFGKLPHDPGASWVVPTPRPIVLAPRETGVGTRPRRHTTPMPLFTRTHVNSEKTPDPMPLPFPASNKPVCKLPGWRTCSHQQLRNAHFCTCP